MAILQVPSASVHDAMNKPVLTQRIPPLLLLFLLSSFLLVVVAVVVEMQDVCLPRETLRCR